MAARDAAGLIFARRLKSAEIAMLHQIPLWVKTSFQRARGTLIAPLAEIPGIRWISLQKADPASAAFAGRYAD